VFTPMVLAVRYTVPLEADADMGASRYRYHLLVGSLGYFAWRAEISERMNSTAKPSFYPKRAGRKTSGPATSRGLRERNASAYLAPTRLPT
jgi:hypothetical protein